MAERLFYALLVELASADYKAGMRFLSHRKVMSHWKVSTPTTYEALQMLKDNGILEVRERSGNYLTASFREKALLLLDRSYHNEPKDAPLRKGRLLSRVIAQANNGKLMQRIAVVVILHHQQSGVFIKTPQPPAEYDCGTSLTIRGIFLASQNHDCLIDFYLHNGDPSFEKRTLQYISATRPDGVIIIRRNRSVDHQGLMQTLLKRLIPVVIVHAPASGTEAICVDFNNVGMGYNAAEAFLCKGHTKLGVFSTKDFTLNIQDRTHGFTLRAGEAGIIPQTFISIENGDNSEEMERVAKAVIASGVTAVFSTGHELLQAALSIPIFKEAVLKKKIDVISCSSTSRIKGLDSPVDIMLMDFEELGRSAFQTLRDSVLGSSFAKGYMLRNPHNE